MIICWMILKIIKSRRKVFIDNGPHNVYCAAPGLQSISITIESGDKNVVLNLVKKSGFLIKLILTRVS